MAIVEFLGPESDENQPVCRSSRLLLTIKLKLMKRFELKNFIEKQFEQYGLFGLYKGSPGVQEDCTDLLYIIEDNILDKVEELYVQY